MNPMKNKISNLSVTMIMDCLTNLASMEVNKHNNLITDLMLTELMERVSEQKFCEFCSFLDKVMDKAAS